MPKKRASPDFARRIHTLASCTMTLGSSSIARINASIIRRFLLYPSGLPDWPGLNLYSSGGKCFGMSLRRHTPLMSPMVDIGAYFVVVQ